MYKKTKGGKTNIRYNESTQGETIEQKVERVTQNKEPIKDGAPIIYTAREEGVLPEYDIRTDRWEVANEAMGKVAKMKIAERENRHKKKDENKSDGGTESLAGTTGEPAK